MLAAAPYIRPMSHPHRHAALHLAAWLGMLVLAVLNGALREALLTPNLGDVLGRQLSTLLLLALFAGWFWFLHRRWPLANARQACLVGVLWLAITLSFETFMGRVLAGKPWSQALGDYDVLAGRIWVLVPLWTLVGPYVFLPGRTAKAAKPVKAVPPSAAQHLEPVHPEREPTRLVVSTSTRSGGVAFRRAT